MRLRVFYFERSERRTFGLRFGSDQQNLSHPSPERSARGAALSDRNILRKNFFARGARENFQPDCTTTDRQTIGSFDGVAQTSSKNEKPADIHGPSFSFATF
jgi:hypothetical protein